MTSSSSSIPAARRTELLQRYAEGPAEVVAALAGCTAEELDRSYPGEWSARQVVHHLADSETASYSRVRMLLVSDSAAIVGYDENLYAQKLRYDRPIEASLAVFSAVRASCVELLELVPDDQWSRSGTHSESGPYGMEDWLRIYAAHAHDHADQIRRARRGEK